MYAVTAWKQKSILPEGWVFGNQLYAVATPVLASLMFMLTDDPLFAMGLASTLMGLGTLLSFSWMLKPVLRKHHERLAAIVAFMSIILLCGDAVYDISGWQLFFTMCSYYGCYAINMFLVFGAYFRAQGKWSAKMYLTILLTCVFSAGTGFQSLRQTVIMVIPLLCVEFIKVLIHTVKKEHNDYRTAFFALLIALSNFLGVLCARIVPVQQVEIFGELRFNSLSEIITSIIPSAFTSLGLFKYTPYFAIVIAVIFGYSLILLIRKPNLLSEGMLLYTLLIAVGFCAILSIDVFFTMTIRKIYYFPLYVLVAMWIAWLCSHHTAIVRWLATIFLIGCFVLNCTDKLPNYLHLPKNNDPMTEVSDYLQEQGITTVYSGWNCGEKIAIASDFSLNAGFWDSADRTFISVNYLCDPSIFEADATECAYIFRGEKFAAIGVAMAQEQNIQLVLQAYFPESKIYIYTADVNLMQ